MSLADKENLLRELSLLLPDTRLITPTSKEYESLRDTYIANNPSIPLAITRPRSAAEVAQIVTHAGNLNVPIVVRSGGHDLFGRSMVEGALTVDMRDISHVEITADRQSAKIGGGILAGTLINELEKHGLVTTFGAVPSVGWIGWATLGGYGLLSSKFGLGVDQILAAKIVNAHGYIVVANPEELRGIRGAGGNFGIIVELQIKTYALDKVWDFLYTTVTTYESIGLPSNQGALWTHCL
jgi:FAD/FMN-containing dehydrogenase